MQITSNSNISSTSDTQDSPSATQGNDSKILSTGVAKISFSVSKKETTKIVVHNKLAGGKAQNEDEQEIEESRKRGISHFEDGQIIDSAPEKKKEKKLFVIPVLQLSNQAQIERLSKLISDGNATEHDKARLALLTESSGGGIIEQTQTTLGQQKWQLGLSTMPTTVEPDEADPDYETMPVGEFGLAFLRGCGWKDEGSAIGKTNPQAVPLRVTKPRPKGLGLGATLPAEPPPDKKKGTTAAANGYMQHGEDGEKKELCKNSFVKCLGGLYKGQCGKVLSMDEENSSIFLELTWPSNKAGRTVRVSQFAVEIMSKAEYRAKMDGGGKEKERKSRNGKATERRREK